MSGDFFDSNVVLYSLDSGSPSKQQIASDFLSEAIKQSSALISFQVVQEVLNGIARGIQPTMNAQDIERFMARFLVPLWRVMPSEALYQRALSIRSRYGFSFYDSLIVAAALQAGCTRLLTEDLQHGQVIENMRIENPFRDV